MIISGFDEIRIFSQSFDEISAIRYPFDDVRVYLVTFLRNVRFFPDVLSEFVFSPLPFDELCVFLLGPFTKFAYCSLLVEIINILCSVLWQNFHFFCDHLTNSRFFSAKFTVLAFFFNYWFCRSLDNIFGFSRDSSREIRIFCYSSVKFEYFRCSDSQNFLILSWNSPFFFWIVWWNLNFYCDLLMKFAHFHDILSIFVFFAVIRWNSCLANCFTKFGFIQRLFNEIYAFLMILSRNSRFCCNFFKSKFVFFRSQYMKIAFFFAILCWHWRFYRDVSTKFAFLRFLPLYSDEIHVLSAFFREIRISHVYSTKFSFIWRILRLTAILWWN